MAHKKIVLRFCILSLLAMFLVSALAFGGQAASAGLKVVNSGTDAAVYYHDADCIGKTCALVYRIIEKLPDETHKIFVQLVNNKGSKIGSKLELDKGNLTNPVLRPGKDNFLVVWDNSSGEGSLKGALVDLKGKKQKDILITDNSSRKFSPAISFDSKRNRYFVVWPQEYPIGYANIAGFFGRFVTKAGNLQGEAFHINGSYPWAYNLSHASLLYFENFDSHVLTYGAGYGTTFIMMISTLLNGKTGAAEGIQASPPKSSTTTRLHSLYWDRLPKTAINPVDGKTFVVMWSGYLVFPHVVGKPVYTSIQAAVGELEKTGTKLSLKFKNISNYWSDYRKIVDTKDISYFPVCELIPQAAAFAKSDTYGILYTVPDACPHTQRTKIIQISLGLRYTHLVELRDYLRTELEGTDPSKLELDRDAAITYDKDLYRYLIFINKDGDIHLHFQDTKFLYPGKYLHPTDPATSLFSAKDAANKILRNNQRFFGKKTVHIKDTSGFSRLILDADFDKGDVDLSKLKVSGTYNKTVADTSGTHLAGKKIMIMVPNNNHGFGVFVCPHAKLLSEVTESCKDVIRFGKAVHTFQNQRMSYFTGPDIRLGYPENNNDTYIISGLNGTGVGLLGVTTDPTTLEISDDTTLGNPRLANQQVSYYASYKDDKNNSITDADCNISFGIDPGPFTMQWDSTKQFYTHQKTFSSAGTFNWSVRCTKLGYATGLGEEETVIQAPDLAPTTTLVKPNTGVRYTSTNAVNFECSGSDDIMLSKLSLYANTSGAWGKVKEKAISANKKSDSATWTVAGIANGTYSWNCLATDSSSQTAWDSSNRTFTFAYSVSGTQPAPTPTPPSPQPTAACLQTSCSAPNTAIPCKCGTATASTATPWCCAADSGVFPSKDNCEASPNCVLPCTPNWVCVSWSECLPGNKDICLEQEDLNRCLGAVEPSKPEKSCTFVPPKECTPGDYKCEGSDRLACSSDGMKWEKAETCEHGCENRVCKSKPTEPKQEGFPWAIIIIVVVIIAGIVAFLFFRKRGLGQPAEYTEEPTYEESPEEGTGKE